MEALALIPPLWVVYYLIVVNFITFAAFGFDKMLAEAQSRRISEAALLQWAFFGGTVGAYAGRAAFRHKTRKQPFSEHLQFILILQIAALAGIGAWIMLG